MDIQLDKPVLGGPGSALPSRRDKVQSTDSFEGPGCQPALQTALLSVCPVAS